MKRQMAAGAKGKHRRAIRENPEILRISPPEGSSPLVSRQDRKTIAILDDQPNLLELLGHELAEAGYEVLACTDKAAFLKKMRTLRIDLIISDINSPGMDGFQFLDALRRRKKWARVPVIITTGMDGSIESDAISRGANGVFRKPYSIDDLLIVIKRKLRT